MILMLLASSPALAGDEHVGAFKPAVEKPRMHFADTVSGKPFSVTVPPGQCVFAELVLQNP